jgi:hypothetical protein
MACNIPQNRKRQAGPRPETLVHHAFGSVNDFTAPPTVPEIADYQKSIDAAIATGPWQDMPRYHGQVREHVIQVWARKNGEWRTLAELMDGDELPALIDAVNSERGFCGFRAGHLPDMGGVVIGGLPDGVYPPSWPY